MEALEQLKLKANILNISGIEKEINCPATTIHRYIKTGYIPKKWKEKLTEWINANIQLS